MTENKKFKFKLCSNGYHYLYFENDLYITAKGDYVILEQSNDIAELLDTLYFKNQELKKESYSNLDGLNYYQEENQALQLKIMEMLDFVKEKETVTREDIKKWWNKKR